jgi:hypothetical protein
MSKTYYSEYINHILRFYIRHQNDKNLRFKTYAEKDNFISAQKVVSKLSNDEQKYINDIYMQGDTLADNIYKTSEKMNIEQFKLWTIVSKVSNQIAKERNLI